MAVLERTERDDAGECREGRVLLHRVFFFSFINYCLTQKLFFLTIVDPFCLARAVAHQGSNQSIHDGGQRQWSRGEVHRPTDQPVLVYFQLYSIGSAVRGVEGKVQPLKLKSFL